MNSHTDPVTYEDFGAVGDGVTDDLSAIVKAHEHANAHRLPVKSKPDATYHLGRSAQTVFIETDTDWSTSRFTIDDTDVEDHKKYLFVVRSALQSEPLEFRSLSRDQRQSDVRPEHDCYVFVENANQLLYRRRGLNQSNGHPQQDCFILRRDGSIEGDIDWEYDAFTEIKAQPMDSRKLTLRGGVFTTHANRMDIEGFSYWARGIEILRSNTEVVGLTHYVAGETSIGQPYRGFLSAGFCANVVFRDCFASAHKTYTVIGSVGKPVPIGSYDLHANNVVNFSVINCRMNQICDRTRWGVIATNFCKNIVLEDCFLSRMDTHMGVSGVYTMRNCTFGHMGVNAIGRGELTLENCTIYGVHVVNLRGDYGSTWEGNLSVRNCRWIPSCGDETWPNMLGMNNDGAHDFGYPCYMPRVIEIDGLHVEDGNHPADYTGMYFLDDPENGEPLAEAEQLSPYVVCERIEVKNVTSATGLSPQISSNQRLVEEVELVSL